MIHRPEKDICPLGPDLQKYWERRYLAFPKFDDGIQVDREGLYSATPAAITAKRASMLTANTIVDASAGTGAAAIAFAEVGKNLICVELDSKRLAMAQHNAKISDVNSNITFANGNFLKAITEPSDNAVFLDPP